MKRLSLTAWIFIGMAVGIALGAFAPSFAVKLAPASSIFLRLIKSIVAPLIFGTLVYGIASGGGLKTMGRIGLKAIVYFEIITTIALFLGLGAVNLVRPGEGMRLARTAAEASTVAAKPRPAPRSSSTRRRQASSTPWPAATFSRSSFSRCCSARPARRRGIRAGSSPSFAARSRS